MVKYAYMTPERRKGHRGITHMQLAALDYWIADKCRSKARAIRKAGYSEAIARQPHKVFESPAVKMEMFFRGIVEKMSQNDERRPKTAEELEKRMEEEAKLRKKQAEGIETIKRIPKEQMQILKEKL